MKKLICLLAIIASSMLLMASVPIRNCECKGIPLHGRVKVVTSHADFRVKVVDAHADLHVRKVTSHPDACGEWLFVTSHEDFTVQIVDSHEDFSIKYVNSHPGVQ